MRSPRARLIWLGLLLTAACTEPSTGPSLFNPNDGPPRTGVVSGRVVEYGTGAPIAGATVLLAGTPVVSDADGRFLFPNAPSEGTAVIAASPIGYLRRAFPIALAPARHDVVIDAIRDDLPFSLDFYREFARNSTESALQSLRRWTMSPSFYFNVKTVGSGLIVPEATIAKITDLFRRSVRELSNGTIEAGAFEVGTTPRDPELGWVRVTFFSEMAGFGSATVGGNMGEMSLRYSPTDVSTSFTNPYNCESVVVAIADHEITHTMGFWHTTNVFVDTFSGAGCPGDGRPAHVVHHAAIVYSRPPGNRDLDSDPETAIRVTAPEPRPGPAVSCFPRSW
jgi:hypothetical protein